MLTCKSPRKVLRYAFRIGWRTLPRYSSKFSRQDFTLPQLFACLVLREHLGRSFRKMEALLHDVPWLRHIGQETGTTGNGDVADRKRGRS